MTEEFDYRANFLDVEIKEDWEPHVKAMWEDIHRGVKEKFIMEFGVVNEEIKLKNLSEIGAKPSSIIAYHNRFFSQIRDAYIFGSYYPSLTGACALGERIFNQLILSLRDYYSQTPQYRRVYSKQSFDNWDLAIETLEAWNVLLPNALEAFKQLKEIRNRSIHFNFSTELSVKQDALTSIRLITSIIENQFSASFSGQEWFIPGIPGGVAFIKKGAENRPFVREILIPNSELVGYKHVMVNKDGVLVPNDPFEYNNSAISDEEFRNLYQENLDK
ncbi:hypothetical protein [Bacillus mycoides]|uniref:hypothetical protein n=1 Tax=Bacillus mycoides TaxID=1405 RepID=UPI003D659F19